MRNLAHYKGAVQNLKTALKLAKNAEVKREYSRAIQFASRRIRQIEQKVLVNH